MNTTVAVVLPEWMVWALSIIIILQGVHTIASIYVEWLKSRIEKERANAEVTGAPSGANRKGE